MWQSASGACRASCAPSIAGRFVTGRSRIPKPAASSGSGLPISTPPRSTRRSLAARERALAKAEGQLGRVRNGLGGRYYKTKTQVERRVGQIIGANIQGLISVDVGTRGGKPTLSWERNRQAIAHARRTDEIYALATNIPGRLTAGEVLRLYKEQEVVERRHRDLKQTLKVRAIFLHNDDRIYALISIVGIALLIFGLIETRLRQA